MALAPAGMDTPALAVEDDLHCYQIKDSLRLRGLVDLDSLQLGLDPECRISKAKYFCMPTRKTVQVADATIGGVPVSPLPFVGEPAAGDRICYVTRCRKKGVLAPVVTDEFGARTVKLVRTGLVCTPAVQGTLFCGDGLIGPGEVCDGADLGGETCETLGLPAGALACAPGCASFDDGDCTGAVCIDGETRPCGPAEGECIPGVQVCSNGVFGACDGAMGPVPETCDSLDNDCDGTIDEAADGVPGSACGVPCPPSQAIAFTGDAEADFAGLTNVQTVVVNDQAPFLPPDSPSDPVFPDVGIPSTLCSAGSCPVSGWDIQRLFFSYDAHTDQLHVGVDCFTICGDGDGDGDPGGTAPGLLAVGGVDRPNFGGREAFGLFLDFDLDVADVLPTFVPGTAVPWDAIVGVPVDQPVGEPPLRCTEGVTDPDDLLNMPLCFGLYEPGGTIGSVAGSFLRELAVAPVLVANRNPVPSAARPDIEFTIGNLSALRSLYGATGAPGEPWTMLFQGFMGSLDDGGVGEDFVPSQSSYVEVSFPACTLGS